jgi:CDP-glycerol glycerophosphotransferase
VAGNRFGDNPAYLYLCMVRDRRPDERVYWVTDSLAVRRRLTARGLPVVRRHSLRGLILALRAGWYVVGSYAGDVSRWCHDGATVLNLWHGVGLKGIERQITSGPLARVHAPRRRASLVRLALKDDVRRPDYVLSTSPTATRAQFMPAFGVPAERCLELGFPRTDHFLTAARSTVDALVRSPSLWTDVSTHRRPVVAYVPTWRDDQFDFLGAAGVTLQDLADRVAAAGGTLLFKAHFNADMQTNLIDRAFALAADEDINSYLPLCQSLITDYSSVATDFLLLDRPIVYFVPDLDRQLRSRPWCFTPEQAMPGEITRDRESLYRAIDEVVRTGADDHGPARQAARRLLWGTYAGSAGAALVRHIRSLRQPELGTVPGPVSADVPAELVMGNAR